MKDRSAAIDPQIFVPALLCVVAVILPLAASPEASDAWLKRVLDFTTHQLDSGGRRA